MKLYFASGLLGLILCNKVQANPGSKEQDQVSLDCSPSPWSGWSPCTVSCGGGLQVQVQAVHSDQGCQVVQQVQVQKCGQQQCPVPIDCSLSSWSEWSKCGLGGGVQSRDRQVLQEAMHGGKECQEKIKEEELCPKLALPGGILNPVVLLTGGNTWPVRNSVEVFSLWKNGSCNKNLEALPNGRVDHTVNFFRGQVIMCGGQLDPNLKYCHSLDQNQRFVPHSQLLRERAWHMAAVAGDKLLVVGGSWSNSVESWDGSEWTVQQDNFEDIRPEKEGQFNGCIDSIDEDTILMAGGENYDDHGNGKRTNKMFKYQHGVWERMEDFPGPPRFFHGCAFVQTPEGGGFLIAGGWGDVGDNNPFLNSSYLYNIEQRKWEEVGKLTVARRLGKIFAVDGRVIMVGGTKFNPIRRTVQWTEDVEEYNVETKTWSVIPQKLKQGREHFDAVVIPGALVGC